MFLLWADLKIDSEYRYRGIVWFITFVSNRLSIFCCVKYVETLCPIESSFLSSRAHRLEEKIKLFVAGIAWVRLLLTGAQAAEEEDGKGTLAEDTSKTPQFP